MLFPPFGALQVQHDSEQRLMRFQWLDPHNYLLRAGLEQGLKLVLAYQPHYALVDFTNLPPISTADELWMSVHWFPQVVRQQLRKVAIVSRFEHMHNQMATEAMFWVARHLLRFQVQTFDDVLAAFDWLTEGNAAVMEPLLAEWPPSSVPANARLTSSLS